MDAKIASAVDIVGQTVDVNSVIDVFKTAGNRMNILVLDACRDNPFGKIASGKGLAQLDAPPGTFLAFATAPDNVAEDGNVETGHGLYAQYLLEELRRPTTKIEDVFKRVRLNVRRQSKGRQIPWESTSLEDDFVFNDGSRFTQTAEELERNARDFHARDQYLPSQAAAAREREQQIAHALEQEQLRLAQAQRLADAQARRKAEEESHERQRQMAIIQAQEHERALAAARALALGRKREAARLKELAHAREQVEQALNQEKLSKERAFLQEKAEWDRIKDRKDVDAVCAFLQKYPSGFLSEPAQFELDQLQSAKVTTQTGKDGVVMLPSGKSRWNLGDVEVVENTDRFTGIRRTFTLRVTAIEGDKVIFNGGATVRDQMGGILKNRFGSFSPAVMQAPADIALGKKWRTAFQQTTDGWNGLSYYDYKVHALEDVAALGRIVKAFRVEGTGFAQSSRDIRQIRNTVWIDPSTMLVVRSDNLFRYNGQTYENSSNVTLRHVPARN